MKEIVILFKNQKYKRIIFISVSLFLLFLTTACYELISSYRSELKRAEVQSNNLSQVLEAQVSSTFTKADLVMSELIRSITNIKGGSFNKDEIKNLINERIIDLPEARTFFVIDSSGFDLFRKDKFNNNFYFGDREYFQAQKNSAKNELFISKPIVSKITQLPTLFLSRKIFKNNQFLGVVATGIPLTYFRDLYSVLDIGKDGAISLSSEENILYARFPWDDAYIGKKIDNQASFSSLFSKKLKVVSDTHKSSIDGIVRYLSSRRVGNSKFFVIVGISKDEVLAGLKKRSTFYFLGFLILGLGCGFYLLNLLQSLQELDERKKMTIQNAKLTSLGEMAAGLAHEINNPLTIISTRSLQLRRKIERDQFDPEVFNESLLKINNMVERIAKIIRGLKSFSRNSDNDLFIPVPLSLLVENTLELCTEKFRHRLVHLKVDAIPTVTIDCREGQLVQVLLNLLNNAFDAVVNLDEKWVHLAFTVNQNNKLVIIITDSGKGIPESIAQNIMQPFFTTKEIGRGTGLGLSISKGIIDDHEGRFYLDKNSQNTRFIIELPIKNSQMSDYHDFEKMSS